MKYLIEKYTGSIDSVYDNSILSKSLKKICFFHDRSGDLYGSIVRGTTKVNLEFAKSNTFEVLKIAIDDFTYYIVKGDQYTLECGSSRSGVIPNFYTNLTTKPNQGFRPPCIGFILQASDSTLFLQKLKDSQVPGSGCNPGDGNCQEFGYLDPMNGYLCKSTFLASSQALSVSGPGYGKSERSWKINGKDIQYVEKDKDSVVGQSTWTFVSSTTENRPWEKFQDFIPKGTLTVAVEPKPGIRYGMDVGDIDTMKSTVEQLVKNREKIESNLSFAPKTSAPNPLLWGFLGFIGLFALFGILALFKKK